MNRLLVVTLLAACGPQDDIHEVTCPDCRIELTPIAELRTWINGEGIPLGDWLPGDALVVDDSGRFVLGTGHLHGAPIQFDSSGRFLSVLGAVGRGPTEFLESLTIQALAGDTLMVLDRRQQTVLFLGPDRVEARRLSLPGLREVRVLQDGTLLRVGYTGLRPASDLETSPLHLHDATGRHLRSFGGMVRVQRPYELSLLADRRVAIARDGSFWTVPVALQLTFQHWSWQGDSLGGFVASRGWWVNSDTLRPPTPDAPPTGTVQAIDLDVDGALWVVAHTHDPRYRETLSRVPVRIEGSMLYTVGDKYRAYDTILEVLDPATGDPLATRRLDGLFISAFGGRFVAEYRETAADEPYIIIYRRSLRGRRS